MGLSLIAYGTLTLGKVSVFFGVLATTIAIVLAIGILVGWVLIVDLDKEHIELIFKYAKKLVIIGLCSAFLYAIIPNKDDMYIIAGAYFTQDTGIACIESTKANELRDLVLNRLRDTLGTVDAKSED